MRNLRVGVFRERRNVGPGSAGLSANFSQFAQGGAKNLRIVIGLIFLPVEGVSQNRNNGFRVLVILPVHFCSINPHPDVLVVKQFIHSNIVCWKLSATATKSWAA